MEILNHANNKGDETSDSEDNTSIRGQYKEDNNRVLHNCNCVLLEVKLPYDASCPSVGLLVLPSRRSAIISLKGQVTFFETMSVGIVQCTDHS